MDNPLLSICCTTYNHEKYIAKALDGFLMQKTNFKFEICIGEDESSDKTRKICIEYSKKYPELINLALRSRKNVRYIKGYPTGRSNFIKTFNMCKGKYIAFCEGDDFWTDENKIQKQVDFLENNKGYGLVFTDCRLLYTDSNRFIKSRYQYENIFTGNVFKKLLKKNYIPTLTVCAHKKLLDKGMKIINQKNWLMGDYPLWLSISISHKIGFINDVTSTHLFLGESASRTSDINKKIQFIKSDFEVKYYFLKRSNTNDLSLEENIFKVFKQKLLLTALNFKDYKKVKHELDKLKIEYSFLDYLYIYGSRNKLFWLFVKLIRFLFPKYKY